MTRSCPLYPPKADIGTEPRNVRFVPIADSCSAAIRDLLEQVLTYFCQQVARAVRLRHVVITSRCSRAHFIARQREDADRRSLTQKRNTQISSVSENLLVAGILIFGIGQHVRNMNRPPF